MQGERQDDDVREQAVLFGGGELVALLSAGDKNGFGEVCKKELQGGGGQAVQRGREDLGVVDLIFGHLGKEDQIVQVEQRRLLLLDETLLRQGEHKVAHSVVLFQRQQGKQLGEHELGNELGEHKVRVRSGRRVGRQDAIVDEADGSRGERRGGAGGGARLGFDGARDEV